MSRTTVRSRRAGSARALLICTATAALAACASGGGGATGKQVISPGGGGGPRLYSPAVRIGDLIFFAGQIGSRPGGRGLAGNIQEETRQALENLERIMDAADVRREDLVKCTVFLADIRDYDAMNSVYAEFFSGTQPPARTAVGVAGLPAGARVEIECFAAARR